VTGLRHPSIPVGAQQLAPGIYSHDGTMHLDAAEFLEANGYEPTPENQDRLEAAAGEIAAAYGLER
jgi:hypothetical protein